MPVNETIHYLKTEYEDRDWCAYNLEIDFAAL